MRNWIVTIAIGVIPLYSLKILLATRSKVRVILAPLGVTGRPEPEINASAREPTVIEVEVDETVIVRSPAFAVALVVTEFPFEKVSTAPVSIPPRKRATASVVYVPAAQVTI